MILLLGGIYLVIDAIFSFLIFRGQPAYCQLVRVGRLIVAVIVILEVIS